MSPSIERKAELEAALSVSERVAAQAPVLRAIPAHRRAAVLEKAADALAAERDSLARLISREVAKPIKAARVEADRAAGVFRWAAAEAVRFGGEWLPLDADPAGEGRLAVVRRFPRGPCLFITPFNFPLNLAAHKIAPAVAVGAPFVLKPPPQAPGTAMRLGEILAGAGWPQEAFAVLPCGNETAEALVRDERFAVLSFTGSAAVGWKLKSLAARKHVVLELGGNGGVVVAEDADLPLAAARCAAGAYVYAGQTCISVQRILVAAAVYAEFRELFLANVRELKTGDPADEATDVGPLIDEKAAARVEDWIAEAAAGGGQVLLGGKRSGRTIEPAVVESPPRVSKLCREEVFGPVATLEKAETVEHALAELDRGPYGLHAGIFTRDLGRVLRAWEQLDVGGLIVNDVPTYRSDAMPYGGNKASGTGREGVRYAMLEYTEPRTLVLKGEA